MSPIFIRPVREQLEHDRLIRHLATKYRKKFEVGANVGDEQVAPVKIGTATFFPDLVLTDGRKLVGLVEVETGESVNNLEAMAQWVHFARARVAFHLYVPVNGYDAARRLSDANQAHISEIWTYRPVMDGFDLVRVSTDPTAAAGSRRPGSLPAVAIMPPPPPKVVKAAPPVPEVVPPPPVPVAAVAKNGLDVRNGKNGLKDQKGIVTPKAAEKESAKEPAKAAAKPPATVSKPAPKPVPSKPVKAVKKIPARSAAKPIPKAPAKTGIKTAVKTAKDRAARSSRASSGKKKPAPAPKASKNAKKKTGGGRSR